MEILNPASMTSKLLRPFSYLYGFGVWLRNKFFDWNLLPCEEFPLPVICVGNLTVGGTGKTPHIEYLIDLLHKDFPVAVLSRGYKRDSSDFIIADKDSSVKDIGDEPYQLYHKFPQITVAVDSDRRRGIQRLLALPQGERPEVILLDDAFQHRYVKPSLSILLTDIHRLICNDKLLPSGRLREPLSAVSRANIVIVTKCEPNLKAIDFRIISRNLNLFPYQHLYFTRFEYGELTPCFNKSQTTKTLTFLQKEKYSVLLLSGIANPEGLISEISFYVSHLDTLIFPDHHSFSQSDILNMESAYRKLEGEHKIIITTEKDFVRLIDCPYISEDIKDILYYLPVKVVFMEKQEDLFVQKIIDHVRNFKRNNRLA